MLVLAVRLLYHIGSCGPARLLWLATLPPSTSRCPTSVFSILHNWDRVAWSGWSCCRGGRLGGHWLDTSTSYLQGPYFHGFYFSQMGSNGLACLELPWRAGWEDIGRTLPPSTGSGPDFPGSGPDLRAFDFPQIGSSGMAWLESPWRRALGPAGAGWELGVTSMTHTSMSHPSMARTSII